MELVQLEKLKEDSLVYQYKATLADEHVANHINTELQKIRAKEKVPGFRPGRAPLEMIKKRYEASARISVIEDLLNQSLDKLVKENSWRLTSEAKISSTENENKTGNIISFIIDFEVMPKIDFPDFTKIELEKIIVDIEAKDIEDREKSVLRSIDDFSSEFDGYSQEEDRIIIDIEIVYNDQTLEGYIKKDYKTIVSKDFALEEFDIKLGEKLISVKTGEVLELKGKYKNPNSELNGKEIVAKILVKKILRPEFTSASQEFIERIGIKSIEDFNNYIKGLMKNECDNLIGMINRVRLFNILENLLEFPIPPSYLKSEIEKLHKDLPNESKSSNNLEKIALRRLRIGMLLADYYATKNLKIINKDIIQAIQSTYGQVSNPNLVESVLKAMDKNPTLRSSIINKAIENVSSNKIFEEAKLVEKKYTYNQLVDELEKFDKVALEK